MPGGGVQGGTPCWAGRTSVAGGRSVFGGTRHSFLLCARVAARFERLGFEEELSAVVVRHAFRGRRGVLLLQVPHNVRGRELRQTVVDRDHVVADLENRALHLQEGRVHARRKGDLGEARAPALNQ